MIMNIFAQMASFLVKALVFINKYLVKMVKFSPKLLKTDGIVDPNSHVGRKIFESK